MPGAEAAAAEEPSTRAEGTARASAELRSGREGGVDGEHAEAEEVAGLAEAEEAAGELAEVVGGREEALREVERRGLLAGGAARAQVVEEQVLWEKQSGQKPGEGKIGRGRRRRSHSRLLRVRVRSARRSGAWR